MIFKFLDAERYDWSYYILQPFPRWTKVNNMVVQYQLEAWNVKGMNKNHLVNTIKKQRLKEKADDSDMSELLDDGMDQYLVERAKRLEMQENPLFRADLVFMPYKR